MTEAPRWEHTLTRRVRSLVRTGPFHRLEAAKGARARDLSAHDLRALALRVIDAVIEHMGLGYGARRHEIADAVAPMVRACEPGATGADVVMIADLVIDHLLNEPNRRLQFDEPYVAFAPEEATQRSVRFHLLREEEADDGTIVLKATAEAINLYAGMLDVDVEDAQTAAEAILQAQLQRGAIGAAVATARQARLRSIEYAESLRFTLRQVRRDVVKVDARAMLAVVQAARVHLDERLRVERGLLEAVEARVVAADAQEAPSLVELRDALSNCRERHLALHTDLLGVHDVWLAEQERQRFRPARASALPELERDVVRPLLAARLGDLAPLLDSIILPFHAPSPPPVLDLAGLADALLAPRRREAEADLTLDPLLLDPITAIEARFDPAVVHRVAALLCLGGPLSALLARSRAECDPPSVRRLLVLRALWAWDLGADSFHAYSSGPLVDAEYLGADLWIAAEGGPPPMPPGGAT